MNNLWTVIFYDGNDNQYAYVEAGEPEEITADMIFNGAQNVTWNTTEIGDSYVPTATDILITAIIPNHVAVNFP